jgi:hypothetical protein
MRSAANPLPLIVCFEAAPPASISVNARVCVGSRWFSAEGERGAWGHGDGEG